MLILFTRGTALGGIGNDAAAGDVRELPQGQAQHLIATGRAVAAPALAPGAPSTAAGKPKNKKG